MSFQTSGVLKNKRAEDCKRIEASTTKATEQTEQFSSNGNLVVFNKEPVTEINVKVVANTVENRCSYLESFTDQLLDCVHSLETDVHCSRHGFLRVLNGGLDVLPTSQFAHLHDHNGELHSWLQNLCKVPTVNVPSHCSHSSVFKSNILQNIAIDGSPSQMGRRARSIQGGRMILLRTLNTWVSFT